MLRLLGTNPVYRNRVAHMEVSGPQDARYGELRTPLSPSLAMYLDQKKSGYILTSAMPSTASGPGRM